MALKLTGGLLVIAVNAVCARYLEPENYGTLVSILSFCALCGGLAALGGDHFFKRYFGRFAGLRVPVGLLIGPIVISLAFAGVSALTLPMVVSIGTTDTFCVLLFVLALILSVSLTRSLSGAMVGLGIANREAMVNGLLRYGLVLFGVLGVTTSSIAISDPLAGVLSLFVLGYASSLLALFVMAVFRNRALRDPESCAQQLANYVGLHGIVRYVRESLPLTVIGATGLIERNIDTLMLAAINGPIDAGLYYVVTRVSVVAMMPMQALNATTSRQLSSAIEHGDTERASRLASRIARLSSGVIAVIIAVCIAANDLVFSVFGDHYQNAWIPLTILLCAWAIRALIGPANLVAVLSDSASWASRVAVYSLIGNVLLNGALIPLFGVYGAIAATVLTRLVRTGSIAWYLARYKHINVSALRGRASTSLG